MSDVAIIGIGIHPFGRTEGMTGLQQGVHAAREALSDAEKNNYKTINILLSVIQNPYNPKVDISKFQTPAPASKEKYQTFCGT